MTDPPELPSDAYRVCPRCGSPADEGVWCERCGLNLRQQNELPTADAFAAGVREQRWLAAQAEEADARRAEESRAWQARATAEGEQQARAKQDREQARIEAKAAKRAEATRPKAERPPPTRKVLIVLGTVTVLLVIAAAAFFVIRSDRNSTPTASTRPPVSTSEPPRCSRQTAQRELVRRKLLEEGFSGVSRLICRDFTGDGAKDAAFTRESTGSSGTLGWGVLVAKPGGWDLPLLREGDAQVGIKAEGGDLLRSVPVADEADPAYGEDEGAIIEAYRFTSGRFELVNDERRFGEAFPDGFYEEPADEEETSSVEQCGDSGPAPIYNVTAENVDCETALEVAEAHTEAEDLGWSCVDEDTGYESSRTVCTKGDARVTYDFAV